MDTIKCPHCGEQIIMNLSKFDLEKTVNDLMQEIAEEQGEVDCYV